MFSCTAMRGEVFQGIADIPRDTLPENPDLVLLTNLFDDVPLAQHLADLQLLNRYSVEARYPGEWEPITRGDATHAVRAALRVRDVVRNLPPEQILPPAAS
jgi:hypothetical protein